MFSRLAPGTALVVLVALTAAQGCKQKEPIPGPKAGVAVAPLTHTPGIAWFQGSFDEAFSYAELRNHCKGERSLAAPPAPEIARARKHAAPAIGGAVKQAPNLGHLAVPAR